MEDTSTGFNENQLRKSGFQEAYTPELQQKMKEGLPIILHNFKKSFEGDQVSATLHLKKSATSDNYFLTKFEMQLQKDGKVETIRQTFYISSVKNLTSEENHQQNSRLENRYTLKEAYNLLDGRPVYKNLFNKEGQEYEAWVKLNFKNKLDNGNYELKQYNKGYGYELENVLSKYAIKELTNEKFKQSLVESLQRGNLQKATFVDNNGKEEKLFISPNITLGALNVYDKSKQRITTEKLVEKQYIGNQLAGELNQRMVQQQNQDRGQKQEAGTSLQEKQKEKQVQKEDVPVKKQTRKQKIS